MIAACIVNKLLETDEDVDVEEATPEELETAGVVHDFGDNAWGDYSHHGDPYIILVGGKPIGWMQVNDDGVNVIEINREFRRRGYAAAAINKLLGDDAPIASPVVSPEGAALVSKIKRNRMKKA